jgi:hypothetical protein
VDGGADAGTTDAGTDAGYDGGSDGGTDGGCGPSTSCTLHVDACGRNCGCLNDFLPDGGFAMVPYCDPDVGNPCALGCYNPPEADGGRQYMGGNPVCFC